MGGRRTALAVAGIASGALIAPEAAGAHGLVGRADLPIPEWLFAWAAAVVLVVSFIALAVLWREPKLEGPGHPRTVPWWIGMAIVNPVTEFVAGLVGVGLLALVIYAGLAGTDSPQANFTPTFVFVIFWVGLVPLSIIFGDVFRALNPWRAIARACGFVARLAVKDLPAPFVLPARVGRWPALVAPLLFTWMELVSLDGQLPDRLAIAALIYTAYTLVAMAAFGIEQWLERGEGFSVLYNLFSRISPVFVEDGKLSLRAPLRGLTTLEPMPGTVAFVIAIIGTTTYDGASEGSTWGSIAKSVQDFFHSIGFSFATSIELADTLGMLAGIALVAGIYSLGIAGLRTVDRRPFKVDANTYVHTLVPIAAAYMLAHYFSFLTFSGQAIIYLISDPLGRGSDIFGTADQSIDYSLISATGIWYVQVGVLVIGHVAGLVLAHDRALATYDNVRVATRSQYWMLGVMVAFTTFGLWLLSQANA